MLNKGRHCDAILAALLQNLNVRFATALTFAPQPPDDLKMGLNPRLVGQSSIVPEDS
jgi:hypothetical protein